MLLFSKPHSPFTEISYSFSEMTEKIKKLKFEATFDCPILMDTHKVWSPSRIIRVRETTFELVYTINEDGQRTWIDINNTNVVPLHTYTTTPPPPIPTLYTCFSFK